MRKRFRRSKRIIKLTLERDGYCLNCGSTRQLECDHIVPLYRGGLDELDNTQTLCKRCHKRRTDSMQSKRAVIDPATGLQFR